MNGAHTDSDWQNFFFIILKSTWNVKKTVKYWYTNGKLIFKRLNINLFSLFVFFSHFTKSWNSFELRHWNFELFLNQKFLLLKKNSRMLETFNIANKCCWIQILKMKLQLNYPFKKIFNNNRNFYDFSLKLAHFFRY